MKRFIAGLGALICLLALPAYAQETYFNVSESEITEKNKVLIQQQFTITDGLQSSTTFDYGLGRNWEIGFNLYNVNYQFDRKRFVRNDTSTQEPYAPLLLLNVQKIVELTEGLRLGLGVQGGANLTPTKGRSRLLGYAYVNLAGSFVEDHYKWSAGGFASHDRFLGGSSQIGFQAGFDAGVLYEKLHLLGEWVSGPHQMGQLVLGIQLFPSKNFPLAIGWQRANEGGAQGLVVQLTFIPQQ